MTGSVKGIYAFIETRPSCAWHVGPLHWTKMTRVTTNQRDLGDEVDQGDEDYQRYLAVLCCTGLYWARWYWYALGFTGQYWAVLGCTWL